MTPNPPLRPTETGSADVEPAVVLRGSSPVLAAALVAAAAAVFLAVVLLAGIGRLDTSVPGFLEQALGPEKAEAPLERTPATGIDVRIHDQGYTVSHWGASVSVVSEDVGGADWRRHVHGVTRETDFGTETIVVDGRKTEEFLTVVERQGDPDLALEARDPASAPPEPRRRDLVLRPDPARRHRHQHRSGPASWTTAARRSRPTA